VININVTIGNTVFTAKLFNNPTTQALVAQFPLTFNMSDHFSNEKYFNMPFALPKSIERVGNIKIGDIMLYNNNCLVLFYKNFSTSYSYTQFGNIEDTTGLVTTLGSGNVVVTFSR